MVTSLTYLLCSCAALPTESCSSAASCLSVTELFLAFLVVENQYCHLYLVEDSSKRKSYLTNDYDLWCYDYKLLFQFGLQLFWYFVICKYAKIFSKPWSAVLFLSFVVMNHCQNWHFSLQSLSGIILVTLGLSVVKCNLVRCRLVLTVKHSGKDSVCRLKRH